jgi:hypothetical protein
MWQYLPLARYCPITSSPFPSLLPSKLLRNVQYNRLSSPSISISVHLNQFSYPEYGSSKFLRNVRNLTIAQYKIKRTVI